jgi:sugar phosphate isomerase/epimerase
MISRRNFLQQSFVGGAALVGGTLSLNAETKSWQEQPLAIFEKVFEGLSFAELADAMAACGATGPEATIRPGGHIEPVRAADEVPAMSAALRSRGCRIAIAATHIRRADERYTESLLRIFKAEGITHYRMGHYYLDPTQSLKAQVAEYTAQVRDLATMNAEFGLQGLYQNHSGHKYLGALGWDAAYMLDGIDPDHLGVALDLRHLRADTGRSWRTMVNVLRPHIRSIYIKDARWEGERSEKLADVPVDTGMVSDDVFEYVRRGLPPMPLCLHMEHMGYRIFEKHEIPAAIEAHRADIAAIRRWLKN